MKSINKLSDDELLSLLKEDDGVAYAEIYQRYVYSLTRFAESKLYSLDDARDLIHDLFVHLWSNRHTLVIEDNLKSYLYTACRYQVINKIRKNVVREEYAARLRLLSPAFLSLEEDLNAKELQQTIDSNLNMLPEKTKKIYLRRRDQEKSIEEIAQEFDLSHQTIKNQISIALRRLRQALSILLF